MILKNEQLLHEFYSNVSEDYRDLNLEQIKEIVFTPWAFTKKEMESGSLDKIRLKYFGVFQVYEGRARNMLKNLKSRLDSGKIIKEEYYRLKEMIDKYLKNYE